MQSSISLPPLSPSSLMRPSNLQSLFTLLLRCKNQQFIKFGRSIHAFSIKIGSLMNTFAGNYIINMYSKCGFLTEALIAFEDMRFKGCDVVTWNWLINSYSQLGHESSATVFSLFRQMCADGDGCGGFLTPNAFTFVGVFAAASCFADLDDCGLEAHFLGMSLLGVL